MSIFAHIPVVSKIVNRRQRVKLRIINKGYKQLKSTNKLDLLKQLTDILSRTMLCNSSLKGLLGQDNFDVELSIRQYLTTMVLGLSFNKTILYSIGSGNPLSHPLPKEWRTILMEQGISVNNFGCAVLWRIHSFIFWGYGTLQGLKSVYFLLKKQPNLGKYVYFDNLADNNISIDSNRHNILNWYLQWKNRNTEINSICHSVDGTLDFKLGEINVIRTDGLPKLKRFQLLKYVVFSTYAVIYSFVWLFFRPSYGFLIKDVLKLKRVNLANDADLARDYLFHNSSPYYRPIWTYAAERKGSRVLFYVYSVNDENCKTKNGYPLPGPWHLINWPYYLAWDGFHTNFIKRFVQYDPIIEVVGPIWFSSSDKCANIPENSIAVFDVTPVNTSFYITLGITCEFYVPTVVNQFLNDIRTVLAESNYIMVHKMKRNKINAHKKYTHNIKTLKAGSGYQQINPDIDALQLIQKSMATISIPFTSTALIAMQEGKPSVYYDPSGTVQQE